MMNVSNNVPIAASVAKALGVALPAGGLAVLATDAGFQKFDTALGNFLAQLKNSGESDLQRRFSILANYINSYFEVNEALEISASALHALVQHLPRHALAENDDEEEAAVAAEQQSSIRTAAPSILVSVFSILKAWSTLCEAHPSGCSFPHASDAAASASGGCGGGVTTKKRHPRIVARDVASGLATMIFERDDHVPSTEACFDEWRLLMGPLFGTTPAALEKGGDGSPGRGRAGGDVSMSPTSVNGDTVVSATDPKIEQSPLEELRALLLLKTPAAFELKDTKVRATTLERRAKVTARALQRSLILEERKRQQWERLMLKEAFESWRFRVKIDKHLRGQQDDRELTIQRLTLSNDEKTKQNKRLQERLLELTRAFDRETHDMRKQLELEKDNGLALSRKVRELMESTERMKDKCDESAARILFLTSENERFQEKLRTYFHASRGDEQALDEVRRMNARASGSGGADDAGSVKHVQENGLLFFNNLAHDGVHQPSAGDEEHSSSASVESLLELVEGLADAMAPVPAAAFTQPTSRGGGGGGGLQFDDSGATIKLADFHDLLQHVVCLMKGGGGSTTPVQPRTPVDDQLRPLPRRSKGGATPDLNRSRSPNNTKSSSTPSSVSIPPPELHIPLWVQLFASTLLSNAPNCFQMAMLLSSQPSANSRSRQRSGSTTSTTSSRASLMTPIAVPILGSNATSGLSGGGPLGTGGKIPIDAVLDVASTVSCELAIVPSGACSDFCVPRVEAPAVAHARAKVMAALERAKAMEAVRMQFICDLIVEERKARTSAR